ncbi:hypothetical protein JAAARDRAFT_51440 [Jaapia argillacea MUCL 33604]|uniref:Uncharacterized protein n=1 Tax=Jaapia argillacea MUCL 33604 TaxID=933084 RepID=A0A067P5K8_9AGAM|nr:hypothetical protein JAAARDRAFT_51440 [Jaapia argillacea MUCL 33604]
MQPTDSSHPKPLSRQGNIFHARSASSSALLPSRLSGVPLEPLVYHGPNTISISSSSSATLDPPSGFFVPSSSCRADTEPLSPSMAHFASFQDMMLTDERGEMANDERDGTNVAVSNAVAVTVHEALSADLEMWKMNSLKSDANIRELQTNVKEGLKKIKGQRTMIAKLRTRMAAEKELKSTLFVRIQDLEESVDVLKVEVDLGCKAVDELRVELEGAVEKLDAERAAKEGVEEDLVDAKGDCQEALKELRHLKLLFRVDIFIVFDAVLQGPTLSSVTFSQFSASSYPAVYDTSISSGLHVSSGTSIKPPSHPNVSPDLLSSPHIFSPPSSATATSFPGRLPRTISNPEGLSSPAPTTPARGSRLGMRGGEDVGILNEDANTNDLSTWKLRVISGEAEITRLKATVKNGEKCITQLKGAGTRLRQTLKNTKEKVRDLRSELGTEEHAAQQLRKELEEANDDGDDERVLRVRVQQQLRVERLGHRAALDEVERLRDLVICLGGTY